MAAVAPLVRHIYTCPSVARETPLFQEDYRTTAQRVGHVAFLILACITVLPLLYLGLKSLAGKLLIPASLPWLQREEISTTHTAGSHLEGFIRTTRKELIEVNGTRIEVAATREPNRQRVLMVLNGNYQTWQEAASLGGSFLLFDLAQRLNANIVFWNYPGVGESSSSPSRDRLTAAACGVMAYAQKRLKAEHLIGWGTSMGGGILARALDSSDCPYTHDKVTAVFHDTYGRLSDVPRELEKLPSCVRGLCSLLIRFFGWEIHSSDLIRAATYRSIVLQNSNQPTLTAISADQVQHDRIIGPQSSLAYQLLQEDLRPSLSLRSCQGDHISYPSSDPALRTLATLLFPREQIR